MPSSDRVALLAAYDAELRADVPPRLSAGERLERLVTIHGLTVAGR